VEPVTVVDEHDLYPIHEEDSVPQGDPHYWQTHYLGGALTAFRPDLRITCDMCHYWERGNPSLYVAPDVSAIAGPPPSPRPNVYLKWSDPPLLFVAEVGSPSNTEAQVTAKQATYERDLEAPEFLYADPPRLHLSLHRLIEGSYHLVPPDASGRVWSAQIGVSFGYDDSGFLRIYTADGEMLLTHEEEKRRADEAERQLAELRAEVERLRGGNGPAA
jgi:Uma2 family endonuclease